ncbi:hypothetical protein Tco_0631826 [Tanacetum coccineum]
MHEDHDACIFSISSFTPASSSKILKRHSHRTWIQNGHFMSLYWSDVILSQETKLLKRRSLQSTLTEMNFKKMIHDSLYDTYFVEYTGIEVQHFRDTLLQHLGNVKKSVAERTRHQDSMNRRLNKRRFKRQRVRFDTGIKHWIADLVTQKH